MTVSERETKIKQTGVQKTVLHHFRETVVTKDRNRMVLKKSMVFLKKCRKILQKKKKR